jgi:hypothetical protein
MGNGSGKEGGDLDGRGVDGFGSYSGGRTAPGAPEGFSEGFAGGTGTAMDYGRMDLGLGDGGGGDMDVVESKEDDEDDVVPTVFR